LGSVGVAESELVSTDEQDVTKMAIQQVIRRKMHGHLRVLCITLFLKGKPVDRKRLPEKLKKYNKQADYI
jgi:hypothetical protein